ncbi:MAG TPA: Ig-like domain-containing protein [Humisphaera sp.]
MATLLDHVEDDDALAPPAGTAAAPGRAGVAAATGGRSKWGRVALWTAVVLMAVAAAGLAARGHGWGHRALRAVGLAKPNLEPPRVVGTRPLNGSAHVRADEPVVVRLLLPNGALNPATVTPQNIFLTRTADEEVVEAKLAIEPAADGVPTVVVHPIGGLTGGTKYTIHVTPAVKDAKGVAAVAYQSTFSTGSTADPEIKFAKVALPTAAGFGAGFTCVQFGPDARLWAGLDDGRILRYPVAADGTLGQPTVITSLQQSNGGKRLLTGFAFDPAAPADAPVLWVTHGWYGFANAPDLSGKVSRLSGTDLATAEDVIVGLPRSVRDHLTNQPSFGPDGALYIPQASNSAFGSPDADWGNRAEHRLNATILRLDTNLVTPGAPIDVRTKDVGGTYDPAAATAPLTVYADGIRLAYDLLWHSNGSLYAPVNGSSAGGNTPAGDGAPALKAIPTAERDWFFRITPGRYYGHPNPAAGHYVLNGANPTAGVDPGEVSEYPVGTKPDKAWRPAEYDFGNHVSPNGVIEYRSGVFHGKLKGKVIVCRYSGGCDLICLDLDPAGNVKAAHVGIPGFDEMANPLDLTEDPRTGNVYVSEYGGQKLTLLRPVE